ncbi:MAG: D-glycerate dehydrogenase [Pirellulaceae bacterium]
MTSLPCVVADVPLADNINEPLRGKVEILAWNEAFESPPQHVDGVYTYGHPRLTGEMMDQLPGLRVISNYGVGVDHIDVEAAKSRGIPVGNTPGILNGATADMAMALLLAASRRLVEGDKYARGSEFTAYDPGYMLGRETHHATIGIVGMGRIGEQIARRAAGFEMTIFYHNRRPRLDEADFGATYLSLDALLERADYVVLSPPLTSETTGMIAAAQLNKMKSTAILVNIGRGPLVDTEALTEALQSNTIYGAALDVTDPEPLPRDHPLLKQSNLTIAPHLGSATEETRQQMAELSIRNLLAGLAGEAMETVV